MSKPGRPKGYVMSQSSKDMIAAARKGEFAKNRVACVIDGVKYDSIKDAANAIGIHRSTIRARLISNSAKWASWTFL